MASPKLHSVVVVNANSCGNVLNVHAQAADTFPTDLKGFKKTIELNIPSLG